MLTRRRGPHPLLNNIEAPEISSSARRRTQIAPRIVDRSDPELECIS